MPSSFRVFDVSIAISPQTVVYPGDPGIVIDPVVEMSQGAPYNVSLLRIGSHSGTHVDAPVHFIAGGTGIDSIPVDVLVGPTQVVDAGDAPAIDAALLERLHIPAQTERLLFKTRNRLLWQQPEFQRDFVFIDPTAAHWLVARGVRLVGIDYLSVEQFGAAEPETHRTLLQAGVVIVEGLDLAQVEPGSYTVACLPIKVKDGDGAPARVVLIQET